MDKHIFKYEDAKQGGVTEYSYSEDNDREFILSKGRVLTIKQGKNRIVLNGKMIDELPKFANRWKVK